MRSIKRALLLICALLVTGPVAMVWAWHALTSRHPAATHEGLQLEVLSIFAFGLLFSALIAIRAGIMITEPLNRLNEGAKLMAAGDLDIRVTHCSRTTPEELQTLTDSFNDMAEKLAGLHRRNVQLRERAERANSSKSVFVRNVTHELRQPVNAISGFADLLTGRGAQKLSDASRDGYLQDINAGARHLLALVNDLLDLARMESGNYKLVEAEFWIDEITRRASRYVEPLANERNIEIKASFVGDPPLIRADERVLFQCLLNLVTNAVRHGHTGGRVLIETSILADGRVEIIVADDGPGIEAQDLGRVLLPFERAQSAANAGQPGSGLGLPIVKEFIDLHGGTFKLTSVLGEGTRARILLPAARVRQASEETSSPVAAAAVARAA